MSGPAGSDTSGVRVYPPVIFLTALAGGFLLQWIWPVRLAPETWAKALLWAGGALVACAGALGLWALLTFRAAGTTFHPNHPTTALAFGGPYRFTRNPMYLALVLLSVGLALGADAAWPLVTVAPAVFTVRRAVIAREEEYLARKFGPPYEEYKKRVRRWI